MMMGRKRMVNPSLAVKYMFTWLQLSVVAGFLPGRPTTGGRLTLSSNRRNQNAPAHFSYRDNLRMAASNGPCHVRILPKTSKSNRQTFELQTAVTTLERRSPDGASRQTVELHAQIHFGTPEYFEYYNARDFSDRLDKIFYELLLDETLLRCNNGGDRYLPSGAQLMSSPSDQRTARQYSLSCQVDLINYSKPNWIHADLTRQEFQALTAAGQKKKLNSDQPLWALASTASTWPGAEAISAFFRPSTPSTPLSSPVTRRLFSNLFLPGNSLTSLLRLLFWVLLPSPELSVALLDWSSVLPRPTGGFSRVTLPVLSSLLSGNIKEARQLVFAQMLVSGQKSTSSGNRVLIEERNEHATKVLLRSLRDENQAVALLYGAMHCPDLYNRLLSQGFRRTKTIWRSAWTVQVPCFGTSIGQASTESSASVTSPNALAISLVIVPFYLAIGGIDWIFNIQDVSASLQDGNAVGASATLMLYLIRHVALYLALSKFVVEWDGETNLFGAEN